MALVNKFIPPPPPPPVDPPLPPPLDDAIPIGEGGHPTLTIGGPLGEGLGGYSGSSFYSQGVPKPMQALPMQAPTTLKPVLPKGTGGAGKTLGTIMKTLGITAMTAAGIFAGAVIIPNLVATPTTCVLASCIPPVVPDPPAPVVPVVPAANIWLHFSCGTSYKMWDNAYQCSQTIGYTYGVYPAYRDPMTLADCQAIVRRGYGMTPWDGSLGNWCAPTPAATKRPTAGSWW
jgi:hypothetical protein